MNKRKSCETICSGVVLCNGVVRFWCQNAASMCIHWLPHEAPFCFKCDCSRIDLQLTLMEASLGDRVVHHILCVCLWCSRSGLAGWFMPYPTYGGGEGAAGADGAAAGAAGEGAGDAPASGAADGSFASTDDSGSVLSITVFGTTTTRNFMFIRGVIIAVGAWHPPMVMATDWFDCYVWNQNTFSMSLRGAVMNWRKVLRKRLPLASGHAISKVRWRRRCRRWAGACAGAAGEGAGDIPSSVATNGSFASSDDLGTVLFQFSVFWIKADFLRSCMALFHEQEKVPLENVHYLSSNLPPTKILVIIVSNQRWVFKYSYLIDSGKSYKFISETAYWFWNASY